MTMNNKDYLKCFSRFANPASDYIQELSKVNYDYQCLKPINDCQFQIRENYHFCTLYKNIKIEGVKQLNTNK
jgi:hypothetical protein